MTQQLDHVLDYPTEGAPTAERKSRWLSFWLMLTFALAAAMISREVFLWAGIAIPQRVLAAVFSLLVLLTLGYASMHAGRLRYIPSLHGYKGRVAILAAWAIWLTGWGLFRGNFNNMVFKELVGFLMLALLLLLGRNDEVWSRARVPLLITLYGSFVLILLTYRTPGYITNFEGTAQVDIRYLPRHLMTIGHSISSIAPLGLLLGAWGLVRRRTDIWRVLLIGSLAIYVVILVVIFEFRGALVMAAELLCVYLLLSLVVQGRLRLGTVGALVAIAAIGFALAYTEGVVAEIMRRFASREGLFQARFDEASAFFKDMGPLDLIVGRGLGGWYNGPFSSAMIYEGQRYWYATHFGFLAWVLRGGFPFLLFAMTFVFPIFMPKPREWYENEYNLAAAVLVPVLLFNILVNPVEFFPDTFFVLLSWGFCFARFSTPVMENAPWMEAPPQQIGFEY